MDMLGSWVLFPVLLTALAVGWGAVVEALSGRRLPAALLPAVGFAAIVVAGGFLTLADATAELTTPFVAAVAAAGLALVVLRRRPRPNGWAAAAAAAVFAVYAAPIVLSGEATFAGYIRLDDTATWMALTDRVMEHGRSLAGLGPSTYEATLAFNLGDGYPVGAFLPLGVGQRLTGIDVAWLIQPFMAGIAAALSLALWALAGEVLSSSRWRAAAAFVAAQSALLFGYYLWGGVKEVAAAMLIVAAAASAATVTARTWTAAAVLPITVAGAGLAGVLSVGGLVWLVPGIAVAWVLAVRRVGMAAAAHRAVVPAGALVVLSLPVLLTGGLLPPTSSPLTAADARGNLIGPLEPAQLAGIWPAGDFRIDPSSELLAYALIAVAILAAGAGVVILWRRRAGATVAYVGGVLVAAVLIWAFGSPWVDAKALATASPAVPFAAMLLAALAATRQAAAGVLLAAVVAAGVLWSNALAYRDVNLAPRDRLGELERIGEAIAGEGPTLMTEYEPYGARHFLRKAEAEGASELRRRQVALAVGGTVPKGEAADTDALDPAGLLLYRSLVLRRSPVQSRPPAAYELVWSGDSYEVWQRAAGPAPRIERLALGGAIDPLEVPRCADVRELATDAEALVAARRDGRVQVLRRAESPPAAIENTVRIRRAGEHEVWLGGSVRPRVDLTVDGQTVSSARHVLNNQGQYVLLGEVALAAGEHEVAVSFAAADLHPGSGGAGPAVGPLLISRAEAADATLVRVPARDWRRLCGRRWDWIETDD